MGTNSHEVTYTVRVHDEGPEGLWAEVDELPGAFASGATTEELEESLREAIELYLSSKVSPVTVALGQTAQISGERVEEQRYLVCP